MAEKLTRLSVPGRHGISYMEWGERPVPEMIATVRAHAATLRAQADAIDAAADADFRVTIERGRHARTVVRTLQEGRR